MWAWIWGTRKTTEEQVKAWRKQIKGEIRQVERDIAKLQKTERETVAEIQKYARAGQRDTSKALAKELISLRRAIARLYDTRGHMNSLQLQLTEQLSRHKMTQTLVASTRAMHAINATISLPQMRQLAKEMFRAGFLEEAIADVLDESPEIEEQADEEVNRVFDEILLSIVPTGTSVLPPQSTGVNEKKNVPIKEDV